MIEARKRLTQLCIPLAFSHAHSLSLYGTHYNLDELPLESLVHILRELKFPSSIHTTNPILQKVLFKPKYIWVKKFLPNDSFVFSNVRWSDYTPSIISKEMQDIYDKMSIHIASPIS